MKARIKTLVRRVITAIIFALCLYYGGYIWGLVEVAYAYMNPTPEVIERIVEKVIVPPRKTTLELIHEGARNHQVSPLLVRALIRQESGKGMRHDRVRYEPHLQRRMKCKRWMTDAECRFEASSFGLMQVVLGLHRDTCDIKSYSDLLDKEFNIHCGLKILTSCLNRHAKLGDKVSRLKKALECYNGGSTYADEVLVKMAEIVVEESL